MTAQQWLAIILIALPALVLVLWPLLRASRREAAAPSGGPADRRLELAEEKAATYRALKEISFDHEAGSLSDDDFQALRDRYEAHAADILTQLDALGGEAEARPAAPADHAALSWTRTPAGIIAGCVGLLVLGVALGVGVSRYGTTESPQQMAGGRAPMPTMPSLPDSGPSMPGAPGGGADSGAPIPPEIMARMLQAARQALMDGQYQQAIAAYQAVLKRDSQNVDAMTHLGLIVAIGGHADAALETFDKALKIDPKYAPAFLYRGQVLYEVKQDYPGAQKALERYVALTPPGEDRQRGAALLEEIRAKSKSSPPDATPPGASR